ncbi:MAG: hypothetical protein M5R42_05715 [Rhodocyclaceae bacterium]|nr:hypothetical protein [Rhodocyclaceae bacterium]
MSRRHERPRRAAARRFHVLDHVRRHARGRLAEQRTPTFGEFIAVAFLVARHHGKEIRRIARVALAEHVREPAIALLRLLLDEDGQVERVLQVQLRKIQLNGH